MNEFFIPCYPKDTISEYAKRLCNISSTLDYTVISPDQVITGKFNDQVFRNEVVSCIENMEERTSGVKNSKGYSNRIFQTYNKNIGTGKLLFIKIPVFKRICKDNYVNEVIGEFEDLGYIFEWKKFYGNDWDGYGHHLYITL